MSPSAITIELPIVAGPTSPLIYDPDWDAVIKAVPSLRFLGDPSKATVIDGKVQRWNDLDGSTAHYLEDTVTARPDYLAAGGANGMPGIKFDGVTDGMNPVNLSIASDQPLSVMMVAQLPPNLGVNSYLFGHLQSTISVRSLFTGASGLSWRVGGGSSITGQVNQAVTASSTVAILATTNGKNVDITKANIALWANTAPPAKLDTAPTHAVNTPPMYLARNAASVVSGASDFILSYLAVFAADLRDDAATRTLLGEFVNSRFKIPNNFTNIS